jgi:hypothetical protein
MLTSLPDIVTAYLWRPEDPVRTHECKALTLSKLENAWAKYDRLLGLPQKHTQALVKMLQERIPGIPCPHAALGGPRHLWGVGMMS